MNSIECWIKNNNEVINQIILKDRLIERILYE